MGKIFCIGEALIDFIPGEQGCTLKEVATFYKRAGGAPANVAIDAAKLGGNSFMICKLGEDSFGTFIAETLSGYGVDISHITYTKQAPTALAFVSLDSNGDRDFIFYRNPSADMLLEPKEIEEGWFQKEDILHFGSVDLVDYPVKRAHKTAVQAMKKAGGMVSFDPNVRLSLFPYEEACRSSIFEFLPYADILKISEEEMQFLFGTDRSDLCFQQVKKLGIQILVVTKGKGGAELVSDMLTVSAAAPAVATVDTTGAGDAFVGAMLAFLQENGGIGRLKDRKTAAALLRFCCAAGSLATTKKGAVEASPTRTELNQFLQLQSEVR